MAKKTVVYFKVTNPDVIVTEYLRYAGIISIYSSYERRYPPLAVASAFQYNDEKDAIIRMECPRGLDGETWAKHNVGRLRSFGVNALSTKE